MVARRLGVSGLLCGKTQGRLEQSDGKNSVSWFLVDLTVRKECAVCNDMYVCGLWLDTPIVSKYLEILDSFCSYLPLLWIRRHSILLNILHSLTRQFCRRRAEMTWPIGTCELNPANLILGCSSKVTALQIHRLIAPYKAKSAKDALLHNWHAPHCNWENPYDALPFALTHTSRNTEFPPYCAVPTYIRKVTLTQTTTTWWYPWRVSETAQYESLQGELESRA